MEPFVIAIVAMVLGYKLLSQLICLGSKDKDAKLSRRGRRRMARASNGDMDLGLQGESSDELRARAELMARRIQTLEEIIASEHPERREA